MPVKLKTDAKMSSLEIDILITKVLFRYTPL